MKKALICLLCCVGILFSIPLNAEEVSTPEKPVDVDEYQTVPVDRFEVIFTNRDSYGYGAYFFVSITGSVDKTENAIAGINLNYSYNVEATSLGVNAEVVSFNYSYIKTGNQLSIIMNCVVRLINNGRITYVSGSKTIRV